MIKLRAFTSFITIALILLTAAGASSGEYNGTARLTYIYTDEEGNRGVNQPTYNLYEGLAFSLESFKYRFENGSRLYGNVKNVTMNNRNVVAGLAKTGLYNVRLSHNKYRRTYSFDGDKFTRRHYTNGSFWMQAHENIRLFGGYGQINKRGQSLNLFEPIGFQGIREFDYSQKFYNAGAKISYDQSYVELEWRGSNFSDELGISSDRNTNMYRIAGSTPIRHLQNLYVNAGFQRFQTKITETDDTLTSNTAWGGLRYFFKNGFRFKYSFVFDRSRRTDDLSSTDNITNALHAGKQWPGKGGLMLGYRYHINDDVQDQLKTNGYLFSGWARPADRLTIRAGYGSEITEVEQGKTLTGDKNYTRLTFSATYKFRPGTIRAKIEDRNTENDDIGSSAEYARFGTDLTVQLEEYGELQAAYDYLDGEYKNAESGFRFNDHVFWGNVLSKRYRKFQAGVGGTYMRSKQGVDVESFSVRLTGNYDLGEGRKIEVTYSAHNFDDFDDPSLVYSRYYTANVVEISVSKAF